jgi:hypothetical protein
MTQKETTNTKFNDISNAQNSHSGSQTCITRLVATNKPDNMCQESSKNTIFTVLEIHKTKYNFYETSSDTAIQHPTFNLSQTVNDRMNNLVTYENVLISLCTSFYVLFWDAKNSCHNFIRTETNERNRFRSSDFRKYAKKLKSGLNYHLFTKWTVFEICSILDQKRTNKLEKCILFYWRAYW